MIGEVRLALRPYGRPGATAAELGTSPVISALGGMATFQLLSPIIPLMPKETMTPRERWQSVLNRETPDRVPPRRV